MGRRWWCGGRSGEVGAVDGRRQGGCGKEGAGEGRGPGMRGFSWVGRAAARRGRSSGAGAGDRGESLPPTPLERPQRSCLEGGCGGGHGGLRGGRVGGGVDAGWSGGWLGRWQEAGGRTGRAGRGRRSPTEAEAGRAAHVLAAASFDIGIYSARSAAAAAAMCWEMKRPTRAAVMWAAAISATRHCHRPRPRIPLPTPAEATAPARLRGHAAPQPRVHRTPTRGVGHPRKPACAEGWGGTRGGRGRAAARDHQAG